MEFPILLAIDYGTQRVGVAVSRGSLADPLTVLAHDDQLFLNLQKIIGEERPEKIILGLSENVMAEETRQFAAKLANFTGVPIEFFDETLSSVAVTEKLKAAGQRNLKQKGPIDHYAAAEVLQEYMEQF